MAANIRYLDSDGVTLTTLEDLGLDFAGQTQTPRKLGFRSISDRVLNNVLIQIGVVAGNDGSTMARLADDADSPYPTLTAPYGFAAVLGGGGGVWGSTGTRGWKITAINAIGETGPSDEITFNVTDITKKVTLTWSQVPGATGYKIYRTDTPGTYVTPALRTTIGSGATVTFDDDGAALSAGVPPSVNTTGGWIVTPTLSGSGAGGVWGSTGVRFWRVIGLDATGVEICNSLEASINVDDVTKTVTLTWPAAAVAVGGFKVFRSTVTGSYPSPSLVATVAAGSTTYIDNGMATIAGSLTTESSYGVPPTTGFFGTADLTTGSNIAIGQEIYFWTNDVIPAGTPEAGNLRQYNIVVKEA